MQCQGKGIGKQQENPSLFNELYLLLTQLVSVKIASDWHGLSGFGLVEAGTNLVVQVLFGFMKRTGR